MKKNITINLFGTLYAIDDDACQLLEQYLNNMQSYFSKREGGDEIVDDIEHRVAELFSELKEQGIEAISIDYVQDIIHRIGNPEQMDDATENTEDNHSSDNGATPPPAPDDTIQQHPSCPKERKLFRDPQDQLVGGVISGFCHYWGASDPLPWRILTVFLAFLSLSTIGIVYLLAWALIPAATTAEDRLQMKGVPVNWHSLNEELMRGMNQTKNYIQSTGLKNKAHTFCQTLLNILVFCLKLLLVIITSCLLIASVIGLGIFIVTNTEEPIGKNLTAELQHLPPLFMGFGLCAFLLGFICLSILFYGSLRLLFNLFNKKPLSSATTITLFVTCLLSAASAFIFGCLSYVKYRRIQKYEFSQYEYIHQQQSHRFGIDNESRNKMAIDKWNLIEASNCNSDEKYFDYSDDFEKFKERIVYKFEKDDEDMPMTIKMERTENLPAGKYHLVCISSVDGPGMLMFNGNNTFSIHSVNNLGEGNFATMPYNTAMTTGVLPDTLTEPWWLCHQRKKVSNWNYQCTPSFHHKGGAITYGIKGTLSAGAEKVKLMKLDIVKD